jgi:hypothetical protein
MRDGSLCVGPSIRRVERPIPFLSAPLLFGGAHLNRGDPMVHTHWFREQPAIVRSVIGFVVMAAVLCLFLGPMGVLYALGFEVLYLLVYLLSTAFAALLDPDVY